MAKKGWMDKDTFLTYNMLCKLTAVRIGLLYHTQYSYNGPKVARTKFWSISSSKKVVRVTVRALKKLPFVQEAKYEPAMRTGPGYYWEDAIRVVYKQLDKCVAIPSKNKVKRGMTAAMQRHHLRLAIDSLQFGITDAVKLVRRLSTGIKKKKRQLADTKNKLAKAERAIRNV